MASTSPSERTASAGHCERGQAAVLCVVSLVCLLGMAALVLDLGYAFLVKRRAQAAADASALAAAAVLPNTSLASSTSGAYATKNFSGGTVAINFSNTYSANDTASTTATASSPRFFARLFGLEGFTPAATASATIASFHNGSSAPFQVTGLAWFIITSYDKDTVTGMFMRSAAQSAAICPTASNANAACPVGPYDPDGFNVVQLVQ